MYCLWWRNCRTTPFPTPSKWSGVWRGEGPPPSVQLTISSSSQGASMLRNPLRPGKGWWATLRPLYCYPQCLTCKGGQAPGDHQAAAAIMYLPTVSILAHHAFNLYRECVGAGQWARVVIEQLPAGETISFFSRPMAAATAAATGHKKHSKRQPNKKRLEKKKLQSQP